MLIKKVGLVTGLFFHKNFYLTTMKEKGMVGRVARYQADRTKQKLYFTRVYCQLAEETEIGQLQDAHIESAVMHLYGGYLAFLQEIARYYNLSLKAPSLDSISEALEQKTQVSPEVLRLKNLYRNDFLGEIEQAWQQILYKPTPKVIEPDVTTTADDHDNGSMRLPIIDVMAKSTNQAVSSDMVRRWRSDLLAIIDSLREGMIEF